MKQPKAVGDKKVILKTGITGNLYLYSQKLMDLVHVCNSIGKAHSSIYYNEKYKVMAIRIKDKAIKKKLREYYSTIDPTEHNL